MGVKLLDKIKNAKIGSILPIYEAIDYIEPMEFFIKLSNYGRNKNAILLESADTSLKERSLGSANPCLKVTGKNEDFEINALSNLGRKFLQFLKGDFKFCDKVEYGKNAIKGKLKPARRNTSEDQRLKLKTHLDILRTVAFKFKPIEEHSIQYGGLFGVISYDFVDQFEDLPKNAQDNLSDADYEMYFLDNLFVVDHEEKKAYIVANALVMDDKKERLYRECLNTVDHYRKSLKKKMPKVKKYKKKAFQLTAGATKEEFVSAANKIKKHILEGDILLASLSRELTANYNAEPLDIYSQLKQILQGHMFYINTDDGILLGSSLNANLRVKGDKEKVVDASIIGRSNPRGLVNGSIDKDLDNKYEAELKVNSEEVARHIMLIDFARNDLARISERGSIYTDRLYAVEKHSNAQYLASNVKCILRNGLDALHAYLATMNAQAGTPKITAIKLLRQYEKAKRGFYGGSFCCITPGGDLSSMIITSALKLKNNKAYARAEANLTCNTLPEHAFQETEDRAKTCINAIKLSGGLK